MVSFYKTLTIGNEVFEPDTKEIITNNIIHFSNFVALEFIDPTLKNKSESYVDITIRESDKRRKVSVKLDNLKNCLKVDIEKCLKEGKIKDSIDRATSIIQKLFVKSETTLQKPKIDQKIIKDGDFKILAFREGKEIIYLRFDHLEKLGEGANSQFYKVYNIGQKTFQALRIANDNELEGPASEMSKRSIKEDFVTYSKLHSKGLQPSPHQIIVIPPACEPENLDSPKATFGQIMPLYNQADLRKFLEKSEGSAEKIFGLESYWKLDACYQLLIKLVKFSNHDIWHPDLCASNILVNIKKGLLEIELGDLSNAAPIKELSDDAREDPECHSDYLWLEDDLYRLENFKNMPQFEEIVFKMNVFSIGVILYQIITESFAFPYEFKHEYADLSKGLDLDNISENFLKSLIKKMLHKDFKKRITAQEALTYFHKKLRREGEKELTAKYQDQVDQLVENQSSVDESPREKKKRKF